MLRRLKWVALALLVVFLFAAGLYAWHLHRRGTIQSVALAFQGDDLLARGFAECVTESLRRVPGLRVEGGVATALLEGSVRRSRDRLIVLTQLNRPADGYHYWTLNFDRALGSAAGIPGALAAAVVPLVPNAKFAPTRLRHPPRGQAYAAYLEGRALFARKELERAIERLSAATSADAEFAEAWAWLSIATAYLVQQGGVRPNEWMPAARDAAERAVALDPGSGRAHAALGIVKLQYDWDWDAAKRELDRAAALEPAWPLLEHWRERWMESQQTPPAPPVPAIDVSQARETLAKAEELRAQRYVPAFDLAIMAAALHDAGAAFQWLEAARDERSPQMPYWRLRVPLPKSDPRYAALEAEMKLSHASE